MINFDAKKKIFNLSNDNYSYYFGINKLGYLIHLYSGNKLDDITLERVNERYIERYAYLKDNQEICDESYYFSEQGSLFEVGSYLKSDCRAPFAIIKHSDNSEITSFKYHSHFVSNYKISPNDLPHFKVSKAKEAETLVVTLKDEKEEIYLELYYTIFKDLNVLVRFSRLKNLTKNEIILKRLCSLELDSVNKDYELISMHGQWGDDRELEVTPIGHSKIVVNDNHGGRGFRQNPAIIIKEKEANYDYGEVYMASLVYSGNFKFEVALDEYDHFRLNALINDDCFEFKIKSGESFDTPECVLVYSSFGINKATQTMHDLVRNYLLPSKFSLKERPILINSWEPFMFDFDTEKIKKLILDAKSLGIEQVVLDDGWFGKRNNDKTSLGDWDVNEAKINLKEVIDFAHQNGMKFGIWVEPEMISPDSDIYRNHPEFALFDRKMSPTLLRHQLVMDLTNPEVVNYIFNKLSNIFDKYNFDYCKWDFNRYLSEISSLYLGNEKQGEIFHRFVLGAYSLLNKFITRYPNILLETCASGGGRFDLGMLYYSPQIWGSDETNPFSRVMIQFATNIFYPLSTIGAHVSTANSLTIQDKIIVSAFGTFGYELNPEKLTEEEKNTVISLNKIVKQFHHVVTKGNYYVLKSPYKSNFASWMCVTKDQKEALVFNFNFKREQTKARFIRLKGLNPNKYYFNSLTNDVYKGDFYMNIGINISAPLTEGMTMLFVIKEVNSVVKTVLNKKAQNVKREKLL